MKTAEQWADDFIEQVMDDESHGYITGTVKALMQEARLDGALKMQEAAAKRAVGAAQGEGGMVTVIIEQAIRALDAAAVVIGGEK